MGGWGTLGEGCGMLSRRAGDGARFNNPHASVARGRLKCTLPLRHSVSVTLSAWKMAHSALLSRYPADAQRDMKGMSL